MSKLNEKYSPPDRPDVTKYSNATVGKDIDADAEFFKELDYEAIEARIIANLLTPSMITAANFAELQEESVVLPTGAETLKVIASLPGFIKATKQNGNTISKAHAGHLTMLLRLLLSLRNKETVDNSIVQFIMRDMKEQEEIPEPKLDS